MTDPIIIPEHLLPVDGRFGSGPSKVRSSQATAVADGWQDILGTSHRQQTVRAQVGRLRSGLADFFTLPEGYQVVLGNGGSTAFWDAACFGLITQRAQFLSFGEFGSKFAACANHAPHLGEHTIITASPGSAPQFAPEPGIDSYCSPHNETSTGVAISPHRVNGDPDALMIVDATSGAGGLSVDISNTDVYYFAPQKSFGADGGLWIALLSPTALARIESIKESGRWIPDFLDLHTAVDNSLKNQTYNTPAIATILMTATQVDWFNENGGLAWCTARTDESSSALYSWAESHALLTPFVTDPTHRSNVVVTLDVADTIDATQITRTLRSNGILDTEPYRKLGRNQLRIAVFPAVEPDDVRALIACLDYVFSKIS